MRFHRRSALPALLLIGCVQSGADGPPGGGGKADDLDEAEAPVEIDCHVVAVHDDNVLEEGLGSIYDFDPEGFFEADSDSVGVSIRTSQGSKLESGLVASIGQFSFGLHSSRDRLERVTEETLNEDARTVSWELKHADSADRFRIRLFSANDIGYVLWLPDGEQEWRPLATIDCRGLEAPDTLDGF